MGLRLDPTVIDKLRADLGLTNFEQVGQKLNRTSYTVRSWYKGDTLPKLTDLVKLQSLTGRHYGTMLLIDEERAAA